MINAADRLERSTVRILGHNISVVDVGTGPPVVFLHGNPSHSYQWRNLIPYVALRHRAIAIDLPGMGASDLLFPSGPQSYPFHDQFSTVEMVLEGLDLTPPYVVVGQELGATMGIQLARRGLGHVAGLAMLEGVFRVANDETFETDLRKLLADLRSDYGEERVLRENALVEEYLPRLTSRYLTPPEMAAYRQPYLKPGESRRAMLSMIRQLPLQSSPGPIDDRVEESRLWCAQSRVPKLVIGGNPGFLVPPSILGTAARWADTRVASVPGLHFLTEDSPARITTLLLDWLAEIGHTR